MTEQNQPKNWRRMLADIGGYENGLINIPSAGVIPIIDEVEQLRARLDELEKQEHAAFVNEQGFIIERDDMQISSGEKLYLAAGARPVEPAPTAVVGPNDGSTPGIWFVRTQERFGELRDCFVSAPDCQGLPYGAEILGDDEYRDGVARKLADCKLIVAAVNAYRATPQPAPAAQADAKDAARYRWLTDDHKRQATRIVRNAICERLPVMSYSAASANIDAAMAADIFGDAPQPSQEPLPLKPMCCRCLDESDDLLPANCSEKPELLTGAPLGMYHCPDCGAMVCAGFPHGPLCQTCHDRKHPGFDCDHTSAAANKEPT